ncbi:alpha-beta hydrolase superfamily lysophospholipase [Curtobacterium sp. PhB130]|uniref:alpha/beta fold hydrolase n=1 Tax=unclassified Curtobacterium TaxID=257496 RepID=UPI000F4CA21F|nr:MULTISPECIES: alpha/beta hydrolase [unclassified Curtobacterium]ROP64964.1 alpha-beta hydrolase superfamily lysophospholipase [Curtobacterium sp. ZW137]ROS75229.1 alpha-beta hydrolase superfamily lysophospholipase [Curtobacterium sp. PhB130]TCK63863.1 alpha-beta hydrolase superfamily lysophospholipase [Curtobacterium sp. PhB136]
MPTFSAARGDSSFVDAHGVEIVYSTWRAGRPKGIVQIAHGVGEYALRYERLAQDLVRAGYTVVANDHRGHGRTGLGQWDGDHAKLGKLGPGGLRAAIAAVERMTAIARDETPGVPLVLFGQSWGSLMAQRIVNTSSEAYDGVVLSASAYRLPGFMNSGDLNKRHAATGPTRFEWLSRDRAVVEAMSVDPLVVEANVISLFGLPDAVRLLGVPRRGIPHDVPMLLQVGSDDTLGGPRSVERLARAYRGRGGLSDVTVRVYEGARHEVYNETNRDEVVADLVGWLGRVVGH